MDRFHLSSYEELVSTQRYFSSSFLKIVLYMISGITTLLGKFMCFLLILHCLLDIQILNDQSIN